MGDTPDFHLRLFIIFIFNLFNPAPKESDGRTITKIMIGNWEQKDGCEEKREREEGGIEGESKEDMNKQFISSKCCSNDGRKNG